MLSANVTLERPGLPRVALARAALLQAIDELGSLSAAAQQVGLSYKAAWDAVQGLNNLFDAPLVSASAGGKTGGSTQLTPDGRAALAAFRRVQAALDAALARLDDGLSSETLWSLGMKTSARNALRGRISALKPGAVNTEVTLRVADGLEIVAIVTVQSAEDLGLAVGGSAVALIDSSFVILAKGSGLMTSARNQIPGVVQAREDGAVSAEVRLDIGGGKTLVATVTLESASALALAEGDAVTALIKAPHVILAVE